MRVLVLAVALLAGCAHPQKIEQVRITITPTSTCHHKDGAPDNVIVCEVPTPHP